MLGLWICDVFWRIGTMGDVDDENDENDDDPAPKAQATYNERI